jgi:hypothetical protein
VKRSISSRVVIRLAVSGLLLTGGVPALAAPQGSPCGASAASNGTGYLPPSNVASLPTESPRPGPEILYRPLASSPQLENTGPWHAKPIMVSGTRSYRDGELVYQDFLFDDRALTYPAEPKKYAGNAADIVEVRVKPLARALALRITYNAMLDPETVAATIALGSSSGPRPIPHGAGAAEPAQVFVTIHGCDGDLVRASDGSAMKQKPKVATDLKRRQVRVDVPYTAFDPRGRRAVRIAAAAGLWDRSAHAYLRPDASRPAFFNVAFRGYGPWRTSTWQDEAQNAALAAGDLSPFFADVDFTKLAAGVRDDLVDQPGGVPSSGPMDRIHVSYYEPAQGRGNDAGSTRDCDPPKCTYQYSSRLQPYGVYVPHGPAPSDGYGLVLNLHGSGGNHNHFETGPPGPYVYDFGTGVWPDSARPAGRNELDTWRMLAEAGRPSIMVLPGARGVSYFYQGLAATDVFEVWADAAAHYRLNPRYVVQSGTSMGGFGVYKLASEYPDLYVAAMPNIGSAGFTTDPSGADPQDVTPMLMGLRNVPVLATNNANDPLVNDSWSGRTLETLDSLGYRYDAWYFTGPWGIGGHAEYRDYVRDQFASLMNRPVDRNPRRVTYALNQAMFQPGWGLTPDHAYWISGLALRNQDANRGSVDVISDGIAGSDPVPADRQEYVVATAGFAPPHARLRRGWLDGAPRATRDALSVTATNVRSIVIDVDRAQVSCHAALAVHTDGPLTVTLQGRSCRHVAQYHP